ncbi:hypothetical protein INR49_012373, partial [Caranx melampygus]
VEMFRRALGKTLGFVGYTVQYGCIAHCAFEYIGEFVVCSGPSMEPTIVNSDIVFSERMSRHLCKIQKGDIVIAKSPFDPNMNICKRVIGLEGDKVCTSSPADVFKVHQYVSMFTSYKPIIFYECLNANSNPVVHKVGILLKIYTLSIKNKSHHFLREGKKTFLFQMGNMCIYLL